MAQAARRPTDTAADGVAQWPVKETTVTLDDLGYKGWWVKLQINPRAELWDNFLIVDSNNPDAIWGAFLPFVLDWNFPDQVTGKVIPVKGAKRNQLPLDVPRNLYTRYIEALNKDAELPKETEPNSAST